MGDLPLAHLARARVQQPATWTRVHRQPTAPPPPSPQDAITISIHLTSEVLGEVNSGKTEADSVVPGLHQPVPELNLVMT